ncbi:MAG: ABC transporter ATP-binding protein [Deltaproteobacteria bacterium]|nr:ABC transporter ATP-binding protein [Deltaproteobacteria bacterium]
MNSKKPIRFAHSTIRNLYSLKPYFVRHKAKIAVGLTCLLTVDLLQLFIPRIIKTAIDELTLQTASTKSLLEYGLAIVAIALVVGVLRYIWRHLIFGHSRVVERDLRYRLFEHLQKLSLNFFSRTRTGDLMARSTNDMEAVRFAVGMGLVAVNDGIIMGLSAIAFMLYINVKLTLIALIPMPAIIFASRFLTMRMHALFQKVQETFADLTERSRESITGIRVVQAYRLEEWEEQRLRDMGDRYISENIQLGRTMAMFFPMMMLFTNLSLTVVLWLGGRMTILKGISIGDFVAFISYLNLLTWPMMALGWVTNLIQRGSVSMGRINRLLEERPEIEDKGPGAPPTPIAGEVEVRGLSFRYPDEDRYILRDLSFKIEAGSTVVLVGRTGSGKTTLVHLLTRLLEPSRNSIFLENIPIHEWPLSALRSSVAVAPQDPFLFSDTVSANLLFGRTGYDDEWIQTCLNTADLSNDVKQFQRGLETMTGEKGLTLSGRQRQRLALARALIDNPPILILDNALSMVDTATERRILDQMAPLRRGKTNIWISHRVSTIRKAERILVLDEGRVVEQGTHEELIRAGNVYPSIYQRALLSERLEG